MKISPKMIEEVKNRLVDVYNPLTVYLFGSYAWGSPTDDSDLDLLVIIEKSKEKSYKRSIPASRALLDLMIPKEILVYTRKEFEELVRDKTTLCFKISNEGKKIYAKS